MGDAPPDLSVNAETLAAAMRRQVEDHPPEPPRIEAPDPKRWTKADTALQAAFTAATLADWAQTQSFLHDGSGLEEANPLLGKHPSTARLAASVGGALLGHALVSRLLPNPWRRAWQLGGLGVELGVVGLNHRDGARIRLGKMF